MTLPAQSSDEWLTTRNLGNQMIHEYIEDMAVLSSALQSGHAYVSSLTNAAATMLAEIERRGWAE